MLQGRYGDSGYSNETGAWKQGAPSLMDKLVDAREKLRLSDDGSSLNGEERATFDAASSDEEAEYPHQHRSSAEVQPSLPNPIPSRVLQYIADTLPARYSTYDQIQFVIGHGILHGPYLRDEIYCQLLNLLHSSDEMGPSRGWVLLALCAGCFPCSPKLFPYLMCFVRGNGSNPYSEYVEERLQRVIENGPRRYPPSQMEVEAARSRERESAYQLKISLSNGGAMEAGVNSTTTAEEVCGVLAGRLGLDEENALGFSLHIVSGKGDAVAVDSDEMVMDIVSEYESRGPCEILFKKSLFAPWPPTQPSSTATDLIYYQVVEGVRDGQYTCEREDELALLVAQQYFINHNGSSVLDAEMLREEIESYLPARSSDGATEKYLQLAMNIYRKVYLFANTQRGRISSTTFRDSQLIMMPLPLKR